MTAVHVMCFFMTPSVGKRHEKSKKSVQMFGAVVLCAAILGAAVLGASHHPDNCAKFCDLLPNGTVPPLDQCYCYNGLVARGKHYMHKTHDQLDREHRLNQHEVTELCAP
jgi:hypothetical protein